MRRQTGGVEVPETRFVEATDGVHLAYQVVGDGRLDLVFQPMGSHIDSLWQEPGFVRFARRLGRFARTVWYDGRGMGASSGALRDRLVAEIADADLTAVLDAAECDQAVPVAVYNAADFVRFAAAHRERIKALILFNTFAHYVQEDDYPWGLPRETLDRYFAAVRERWGTGATVRYVAPSKASDPTFVEWWARGERLGLRRR
jgi:hypothetical protein